MSSMPWRQWFQRSDGSWTRSGELEITPDGRGVLPRPRDCPACQRPFAPEEGLVVVGWQACRDANRVCDGHVATTCLREVEGRVCGGAEYQPPKRPGCEQFSFDGRPTTR